MNQPIRSLSIIFMAMFLALLLNVTYLQFVAAGDLNRDPFHRRVLAESYSRERGDIVVGRDSVARSTPSDDRYKFQRVYPQPLKYAPVTGYFSYFSTTGIEQSANPFLSGDDDRLFVTRLLDLLGNKSPQGGNVTLTLNAAAQDAAYDGLRALGPGIEGAVVAIEPSTGRILAMVSLPSYDPNVLASHDFAAVSAASERLLADPSQPLLNRTINTTLPPGSTFKLVTAAAAIEQGGLNAESLVPGGPTYQLPGSTKVLDNGGRACGTDKITLRQAIANSCNTTFLQLGVELGEDTLLAQAEAFGFNAEEPYLRDLRGQATSVFPSGLSDDLLAQSAMGQYDVRATPLQMAMVVAGIANDGVVMKPYVVEKSTLPNLDSLPATEPEVLSRAMAPTTASVLTEVMVTTVSSGTGTPAQIPGYEVAGKTGTAQSTPNRPPYAWFVSFAPADNPQVAVAVLVEASALDREEIAGGLLGGPIARAVMMAIIGAS